MRLRYLFVFALGISAAARAQQAGDNFVQIGGVHAQTLDSSDPLHTTLQPSVANDLLGISSSFSSPGTRVSVGNADTLLVSSTHFFNEHVGVKFEGGIPAIFKLYGSGTVAPTGPTGTLFNVNLGAPQNNPLASVRQWSPALLLQYNVLTPDYLVNPYFGLGFTYTFFTNVKLSPGFENSLITNLGSVLALEEGKTGPTNASVHASSEFAPIFNLGASIKIYSRLSLIVSASYVLLYTNARVDLHAADGSPLSTSTTRIDLSTLATAVLLSFRL